MNAETHTYTTFRFSVDEFMHILGLAGTGELQSACPESRAGQIEFIQVTIKRDEKS